MAKLPASYWTDLYNRAHAAGLEAGRNHRPTPMVVGVARGIFGPEANQIVPGTEEVVHDGVCGFAWVIIRPAVHPLAKHLMSENLASKHYYGGVSYSANPRNVFDQSMERKEAYAQAFAKVLRADEGFMSATKKPASASVESRMD